jgi:predicted neuraminidase
LIEAEFLYNPADKGMHCHCPTLLESQSGNLLAVWYVYTQDEYRHATLAMAKKNSNDSIWQTTQNIPIASTYSLGNPVLFQEPGGRIHLMYVALKGTYWDDAVLYSIYSKDEGQTWTKPSLLWKEPGMMVRHPPVFLNNGTCLLPAYDECKKNAIILSSKPPYSNWEISYSFGEKDMIQSVLIKTREEHLIMFFRPHSDPRYIWKSQSTDQGISWTPPDMTSLPNPLSGISTISINNSIAMIYNHTYEHQRYPLSVSVSRDQGTTWGEHWNLDNVKAEVSYPSFISGNNNTVHGLYTYNRRMIKYVKLNAEKFL